VSYNLYPIAVDLNAVLAAIGSKDESLLAELTAEFAHELDELNSMLVDAIGEDDALAATDVLRHLVTGEPRRTDAGFVYGYCFEIICRHFGDTLSNSAWSSMRWNWFEAVQRALGEAGVGDRVFAATRLVTRGAPVELPPIDDFPSIGYLTRAEIPAVRGALASADLSKVADAEAVASIEQIRSWLRECQESDRDLVCTYA
jgi:hypothetical protein